MIILSQNDPDTGLRVMRSIGHHDLPITRSIFTQGLSPYKYMPALNMSLFLSANAANVRDAVRRGLPAGQVLSSSASDGGAEDNRGELRVAFDFDGVLADDESERVMQRKGLPDFFEHEVAKAVLPHAPGPLRDFLANINKIQRIEEQRKLRDSNYTPRVRVSIVTARNAPAHERAIASLKAWGVTVNDAFFLGGIDKGAIMTVLKPHMFFDGQKSHLARTAASTPSVHIPFGIVNELSTDQPTVPPETSVAQPES